MNPPQQTDPPTETPTETPKLTPKQRLFVDAYFLANCNATEAARRAGYKHPNDLGPRLKNQPAVAAAIEERLRESAMSADEVLARLADEARGIGDYLSYLKLDTAMGPVRIVDLDWDRLKADGKAHLVTGWEYDRGSLTVKFTDPQAALIQLGRHHKLFTDRVEHDDPDLDARIAAELAKLEAKREAQVPGEAPGAESE